MFVREWALERWEENTQVSLVDQLPAIKKIIQEQREREETEAAAVAAIAATTAVVAGAGALHAATADAMTAYYQNLWHRT